MKLLNRSLLLTAMILPGMVNAAMLRFDVSATTSTFVGGEIGMLPGSYFIVDTSVANSSTDPLVNSQFHNSIAGGHIEAMDPLNGPVSIDIPEDNNTTITAVNDSINTTWTIPVENDALSQAGELMINYSDSESALYEDILDRSSFYNDNFIDGSLNTSGLSIPIASFQVTELRPAPIPIPPTFLLMASSLVLLLWRSNLSIANIKGLLARA